MRLERITGPDDLAVGDIITENNGGGGYYDWMVVSIEGNTILTTHRVREEGGDFSERPMSWNISSWTRGNIGKYVSFRSYDPSQVGDTDDDI